LGKWPLSLFFLIVPFHSQNRPSPIRPPASAHETFSPEVCAPCVRSLSFLSDAFVLCQVRVREGPTFFQTPSLSPPASPTAGSVLWSLPLRVREKPENDTSEHIFFFCFFFFPFLFFIYFSGTSLALGICLGSLRACFFFCVTRYFATYQNDVSFSSFSCPAFPFSRLRSFTFRTVFFFLFFLRSYFLDTSSTPPLPVSFLFPSTLGYLIIGSRT